MADAVKKRSDAVVRPQSAYSRQFMLANLLVVVGFVGGCGVPQSAGMPGS